MMVAVHHVECCDRGDTGAEIPVIKYKITSEAQQA
jgi:hypothetical protein